MESNTVGYENDIKPGLEHVKPICRGCLSTESRIVYDVHQYSVHFRDLAGIKLSESDGLPRWICVDCSMLLRKSLRFKHKLLKAHNILYEYLTRCAPFPIDGQDPELSRYSSPPLLCTNTLVFDTLGKKKNGFHKTLEHEKRAHQSLLDEMIPEVCPEERTYVTKTENCSESIKDEDGFTDYEDNIPLEDYKTNIDKVTEEYLENLLQENDLSLSPKDLPTKKRKKSKRKDADSKSKKRKHNSEQDENQENIETQKSSVRKSVDVDPTKIKIITLNPEEQIRQREEESKTEGYLRLPYKCALCYKGFNFEEKLNNHMAKHSPSRGKHECKLCKMFLPTSYSYNVHMLIHTRRFECLKCGRRMIDRASIIEHYKVQHEGIVTQYTCHLCGKVSSNNKTHRGHMRNHHGGERPSCHECGKSFVNKDSLAEHILIHQGIKNYECPECGKKFRTKTQVKHHQLSHSNVKEYYCVECDVRFKSAHNLRQHLLKSLKHRDPKNFQYVCGRAGCVKRFETAALLAAHCAVQHERVRPHPCRTCGAALASRTSLAKHRRRHLAAPPPAYTHQCHACGRAFRGKSVLLNHVRTHTGEKPFPCAQCGRRFTQRAAMTTHTRLVHLKLRRSKIKPEGIVIEVPALEKMVDGNKMADAEVQDKMADTKEEPMYEVWRHSQIPCDDLF